MPRLKHILKYALPLALLLGAVAVLYSQWKAQRSISLDWPAADKLMLILPFVILLGILNWAIEIRKWQFLSSGDSFLSSAKQVLRGLSLALVTPNRLGEVLGRVSGSKEKLNHTHAFLIGSLAQSCITLAMAILGWAMLENGLQFGLILLLLALLISFLILGTRLPVWLNRLKLPSSWQKYTQSLSRFGFWEMGFALLLSLLRYLAFSFQYVLALWLFGAEQDWAVLWSLVALSYLASSLVPAAILGELGVRESVALLVMSAYCPAGSIVAATLLVWAINLLLPAIAGSISWIPINKRIPRPWP